MPLTGRILLFSLSGLIQTWLLFCLLQLLPLASPGTPLTFTTSSFCGISPQFLWDSCTFTCLLSPSAKFNSFTKRHRTLRLLRAVVGRAGSQHHSFNCFISSPYRLPHHASRASPPPPYRYRTPLPHYWHIPDAHAAGIRCYPRQRYMAKQHLQLPATAHFFSVGEPLPGQFMLPPFLPSRARGLQPCLILLPLLRWRRYTTPATFLLFAYSGRGRRQHRTPTNACAHCHRALHL